MSESECPSMPPPCSSHVAPLTQACVSCCFQAVRGASDPNKQGETRPHGRTSPGHFSEALPCQPPPVRHGPMSCHGGRGSPQPCRVGAPHPPSSVQCWWVQSTHPTLGLQRYVGRISHRLPPRNSLSNGDEKGGPPRPVSPPSPQHVSPGPAAGCLSQTRLARPRSRASIPIKRGRSAPARTCPGCSIPSTAATIHEETGFVKSIPLRGGRRVCQPFLAHSK